MALITSAQAARRLGVKPETLYAYVSRGLLERRGVDAGRRSLFDADDVERLVRRGRPRQATRPGPLALDIETAITSVHPDGHRYRGRSAVELAGTWTFEQVAEWLWRGEAVSPTTRWPVPEWADLVDVAALADVGPGARQAIDRHDGPGAEVGIRRAGWTREVPALVATFGMGFAPRATLRPHPEQIALAGRQLIAATVDRLPAHRPGTAGLVLDAGRRLPDSIAGRLWGRLTRRRPTRPLMATLNAALVLMADHELASSTLAVRVAASTRADPAAVVLAGLGALSGRLHGGESSAALSLLISVRRQGVEASVERALAIQGRLPGFGHRLYPDGDPRAVALMTRLRHIGADTCLDAYDQLAAFALRDFGHPNCDMALAALAGAARFEEQPEMIFTVARMAGWLAHAIEEYQETPLRYRPRATYVGN